MSVMREMINNGKILYEPTVNGKIVVNPHTGGEVEGFLSQITQGIIKFGSAIIKFIAENGTELAPVFTIVAIAGFILIICGNRKWGCKLTSCSVLGYIACKVVEISW